MSIINKFILKCLYLHTILVQLHCQVLKDNILFWILSENLDAMFISSYFIDILASCFPIFTTISTKIHVVAFNNCA